MYNSWLKYVHVGLVLGAGQLLKQSVSPLIVPQKASEVPLGAHVLN